MNRAFTLAHGDGRPWTGDEFDAAVARRRSRFGLHPADVGCDDYCVSCIGVVYLVDVEGMAWSFAEGRDDMAVVWDE